MRTSGLLTSSHIYMVSSCPPGYQDRRTEARCRRKVSEDYTYTYHMDLPVASLQTGRVYRRGLKEESRRLGSDRTTYPNLTSLLIRGI